jgi:hypothetical protein
MKPITPAQHVAAFALGAFTTIFVSNPVFILGQWVAQKNMGVGMPIMLLGGFGILFSAILILGMVLTLIKEGGKK